MNPEAFNTEYRACLDEYMSEFSECFIYNKGLDTRELHYNGNIVRKDRWYQLPAEAIEFCNSVNAIPKLYSHNLVVPKRWRCLPVTTKVFFTTNHSDWVQILVTWMGHGFCVNCNPRSEHYGKVLINCGYYNLEKHAQIVYQNISELIDAIQTWLQVEGTHPEVAIMMLLDERLQYMLGGETLMLSMNEIFHMYNTKLYNFTLEYYKSDAFKNIWKQQRYKEKYASNFIEWYWKCVRNM